MSHETGLPSSRGWLLAVVALLALTAAGVDQANPYNHLAGLAAIAGSSALALAAALARRPDEGAWPIGPVGILLLAFWAWGGLAILWSAVPYQSILQFVSLGAVALAYAAWRIASAPDRREVAPALYNLLLLGGVVMALGMTGQGLAGHDAQALFLNPNSAAALLNVIWPLAAIAWLTGAGRVLHIPAAQRALPFAIFLMAFALGLEGGRASFLATGTALAVVIAGTAYTLRTPPQRLAVVAVLVLGGLLTAYLANVLGITEGRLLADRVASLADPKEAGRIRFLMWSGTWELIRENPWLGIGPGVFWLAYAAVRPPGDGTAGMFAHNDYLHFWAERGIPGLLLVIALIAACIYLFTTVVRAGRTGTLPAPPTAVAVGAFAAAAGLGLHGFFSYQLQLSALLIPVMLLLAELERLAPTGPLVSIPMPRWRRPLAMISAVGAMVTLFLTLFLMAAVQWETERGIEHMKADEYEAAERAFLQARKRWGMPDVPWLQQAELYKRLLREVPEEQKSVRRELLDDAFRLLDEAQARNPLRPGIDRVRAELLRDHPDLTDGDPREAFETALSKNPRATKARLMYAAYLWQNEGPEAAREVLEKGAALTYWSEASALPLYRMTLQARSAMGDHEAAAAMREQVERLEAKAEESD